LDAANWTIYRDYWDNHARNVGPEHAVTHMNQQAYTDYYRPILKVVAPAKVGTILDIGCGAGMLVPLVHELWPDATYAGIDISPVMVAFCKEHHPECHFGGLDDSPGKVDFIIMHSVITHTTVEDAELHLDGIAEHLLPDGRASISIHTNPANGAPVTGDIHRVDYAPAYFESLLAAHGLRVYGYVDGIQRYYSVGVK